MKNYKNAILSVVLSVFLLTGCTGSSSVKTNNEFNSEKMITVTGNEVDLSNNAENIFISEDLGFGFLRPTSWEEISFDNLSIFAPTEFEMNISYIPTEYIDKILSFDFNTSTQDDANKLLEEINDKSFKYMSIYRVDSENEDSKNRAEDIKKSYSDEVLIGKIKNNSYYMSYNKEFNKETFSEDDIKSLEKLITGTDEIKNNMILFPPKDSSSDEDQNKAGIGLQKFTANDLNGNTVTEEIFKDYDVTMINFWTTWCGYCIDEMPELQKLYGMLPENANMITICCDADTESDLAKEILSSVKSEFTTLIPNEELNELIISKVSSYPTTIFVNSKGEMIGKPQLGLPVGVGAKEGETANAYLKLINDLIDK